MALVKNPLRPPETYVQAGTAASALVVLQTPPPAAPTQSRQKAGVQPLNVSIAIAVTRPAIFWVPPVKVKEFGSVSVNPVPSPTFVQKLIGGGSSQQPMAGLLVPLVVAADVVLTAAVGVGVGLCFLPPPFLPPLGVGVGEGGGGVGVADGGGGGGGGGGVAVGAGVAFAKKFPKPACALISAPKSISSGPGYARAA